MTGARPGVAVHCRTTDVDGTRALAGALAAVSMPGDIVLLAGDLGTGKTAFAQGFGVALGVGEPITSPTFALVRQYPCDRGPIRTLIHADVYRLEHLQEIVDLGLGELVEEGGVAVVEWGDRAEPVLGSGSLTVHIVAGSALPVGSEADPNGPEADDDLRTITLAPIGPAWDSRWERVTAALAPWAVSR